jgi:hypothetical protein
MRASYKPRLGWTKVESGLWDFRVAGYRVRYCGHPTALWPYYGQTPRTGLLIAPNGRGFRTLNQAQAAVEAEYLEQHWPQGGGRVDGPGR